MFDAYIKMAKRNGIIKASRYGLVSLLKIIAYKIKGSFSQKGEDLVIDKILGYKPKGFYVDVGAHHPSKLSNTKRFYLKGWCGINIEPNPSMFKYFLVHRKRDINLNIGISNINNYIKLYAFKESAMSTFSKTNLKKYQLLGYKLNKTYKIPVNKLSRILTKHKVRNIDFLSIDTEGSEMNVLRSNDWKRFRPKVICIETEEHDTLLISSKDLKAKISRYLGKYSYREYCTNGLNTIYIDYKHFPIYTI